MSQSRRWIEVCGAIGLVIAFAVVQAVGQPRGRPQAVPDNADTPPPAGTSRGENFSLKPPEQLFAADCTGAGCHRGPQGLAKGQNAFGLTNFLRQHYTNSQQSAAALAAYLAGVPGDARPGRPKAEPKSRAAVEPDAAPKQPAEKKQPPATAKLPQRGKQATAEPTPAAAPTATSAPEPPAAAPAPPPTPPPSKTFDIFD